MIFRIHFTLILALFLLIGHLNAQDSATWVHIDSSKNQFSDTLKAIPNIPPDSTTKREYYAFGFHDSTLTIAEGSIYGAYAGGILQTDNRLKSSQPSAFEPSLAIRAIEDRDWIFYLFCFLLLFLALLNISFRKYLEDLFRVMLNTSLRQKQIREQLAQAPLPSLLLNIYFFISSGVFLFFMLNKLKIDLGYGIIGSMLVCTAVPASIYLGKYLLITTVFWIFDRKDAAENYLFIVFLVNKVAGIFLILFSVLLAYASLKSIGVIPSSKTCPMTGL
ncbi:MAG: DUF4271 domain-containing protein, partial [Chitinophagaceae bacterium]